MKTRIIYQNILPPPGYMAIAFFGVILARKKYKPLSDVDVNHEAIHAAQASECGGWILYYIRYLWQWIRVGFNYDAIPFEREAYRFESSLEYLKNRERFAWKKYLET